MSIFNQIQEKLIFSRPTKFLDEHNVIFSGKFGSTEHAPLLITDKIQRVMKVAIFSVAYSLISVKIKLLTLLTIATY